MADLMTGKRALVMGVANERSIAWGIAKALAAEGAELAFSYQGEAFGKRVEPLAASLGSDILVDMDVTDDAALDTGFAALWERWDRIDVLVHAIAFSDKSELTGRFVDTSRANFKTSLDISCYSFIEVARRTAPKMTDGGTMLTLTPAYDICPQGRSGQEASQAMLISGQNRMSRIASCLEAAHHFLVPDDEAIDLVAAQLRCIGANWNAVCEEAALSETDRNFFWGRQFLNPFAFTALDGKAAVLAALGDEIRRST